MKVLIQMMLMASLVFGVTHSTNVAAESPQIAIKEKPRHADQAEMICLAKNIFFEARGTDEPERIRIINVTTNRVESDKFPRDTYCGVVYQHAQFSWTLNLRKHNPLHYLTERSAWLH